MVGKLGGEVLPSHEMSKSQRVCVRMELALRLLAGNYDDRQFPNYDSCRAVAGPRNCTRPLLSRFVG